MPTVADPIHALYHKITWKLIPFLCFCYLAAYLDRINIGFAKLQMQDQLQFSETAFGLGAGLFFVGYILFEVPSNLILERVGARIWIARIMITWGLLSACTLLVTSTTQFYVLRFLLGVAEAGFLPGVLYYLTTWFPTHRRGRVIALFMIGLPLSSVIGGPLSGWIMSHFDQLAGLRGWQWLFLLEALPSVLLGVLAFWALPNTYHQAKWLSAEEKALLQQQLHADASQASHSPRRFRDGFFNIKVWMLGGIDFDPAQCLCHGFLDADPDPQRGDQRHLPYRPAHRPAQRRRAGRHAADRRQLRQIP